MDRLEQFFFLFLHDSYLYQQGQKMRLGWNNWRKCKFLAVIQVYRSQRRCGSSFVHRFKRQWFQPKYTVNV